MSPDYETWFGLVAAALYLKDALLLLRPDEAVLEHRGRGRWQARFGTRHWKLAGREVWLPNLFTPHRAVFRLSWRMEGEAPAAPVAQQVAVPRELRRLGPFAWVAWIALFVLLPVGLYTRAGSAVALVAIVLLYANNLVALGLAYRWRDRLGIGRRPMLQAALECLACAPYSVNLVRRLCSLMPAREDFVRAANRLLDAESLEASRAQCLLRVDEQIEAEAPDSRRSALLIGSRSRFQPSRQA